MKLLFKTSYFEKGFRSISFLRVMPTQADYFLCEVFLPYTANSVVIFLLENYNILTHDCSTKTGFDGQTIYGNRYK